jgi:DNA-binding response OmpR family regulator
VNLVLLSNSKDRVDAIRAASKRKGFACTVVGDEQEVSHSIDPASEGILVVDTESAPHLDRILKNRSPRWPVLVLAARFDSSAWVELFKAGASEVICDPLNAGKLDTALDGFLPQNEPRPSKIHALWRGLAHRLGLHARPPMR